MDEGTCGDRLIPHYPRIKNDCKKDFIEKWLVNLTSSYEFRSKVDKELDSNIGTLQSEYAASSQLDFWDVSEENFRTKKKVSKLQFLNALKNIFKKKKGVYETDEIADDSLTGTTLNIMSVDTDRKVNTGEETIVDERTNNDREGRQTDEKSSKDGGTQAQWDGNNAGRIGGRRPATATTKTLDQFSRGFSEILQIKEYNNNRVLIDSMSVTSDEQETKHKHVESCPEPNMMGDGWAIVEANRRKSSNKPNNSVIQQPHVEWPVHCPQPSVCSFNQVDSYIEKVELIKRYYDTMSTKGQTKPTKNSITLVRVPLGKPNSLKAESTTESSALTKDLTEVPYLREHERLQWQGKNREIWFRINALYNKFRQNETGSFKNKLDYKTSWSRLQKPSSATGRCDITGTNTPSRGEIPSDKTKECGSTSFASFQGNRNAMIEEMFVSERLKTATRQMQPPTPKPIINEKSSKSLHTAYKKMKEKTGTSAWHDAVEQVRASMKKMSEEMIDVIRSVSGNSKDLRCQSKISVALSSSDWEDISIPSVASSSSRHTMKIDKPLPNIPYTPSFRHHFRTKF